MKTFTTRCGTVGCGIKLSVNEKLGLVCELGELGRGRQLTQVKLDSRTPPTTEDNVLHHAGLAWFEAGGVKRHVFTSSSSLDHRALVRVDTSGTYTRNAVGRALMYWGNGMVTAQGNGAHGDAGRIGYWTDDLWILEPGSALFVKPDGGHKTKAYILYYSADEQMSTWEPEDFRTEVLTGIVGKMTQEERESALAKAREMGHTALVTFLEAGAGTALTAL